MFWNLCYAVFSVFLNVSALLGPDIFFRPSSPTSLIFFLLILKGLKVTSDEVTEMLQFSFIFYMDWNIKAFELKRSKYYSNLNLLFISKNNVSLGRYWE